VTEMSLHLPSLDEVFLTLTSARAGGAASRSSSDGRTRPVDPALEASR